MNFVSIQEEINWNEWEENPTSVTCDKSNSVQEQIELFRLRTVQSELEPQPQVDYFEVFYTSLFYSYNICYC